MKIKMIDYVARDEEWAHRVQHNKMNEINAREYIMRHNTRGFGEVSVLSGIYRHMGWEYDIRDEWDKYIVESPYNDLHIFYAPSREVLLERISELYGDADLDNFVIYNV